MRIGVGTLTWKCKQITFVKTGPTRAAAYYGCLDLLIRMIRNDEQPIAVVTIDQVRDAAKSCLSESDVTEEQIGQMLSLCDQTSQIDSCLSSIESREQLMSALDFCIFDVNNMTAEERKEFIVDSFGKAQVSGSEFDVYSIYYSHHGSLLYTAVLKNNGRMIKIIHDHSPFSILEAAHAPSGETALDTAVRLCHLEVCTTSIAFYKENKKNLKAVETLTEAGADILHEVDGYDVGWPLDGIPLLHRTIKGDISTY